MHGSFKHSDGQHILRDVAVNRRQAERVVAAFNTWAYKREQPSRLDQLYALAEAAVLRKQPLQFVLYWGKGPRRYAAGPERDCLNYLQSMLERIASTYAPGAHLELLLTDTHAQLNNHPQPAIDDYFASVRDEANTRGFGTRLLSSMIANYPLLESDRVDASPSEKTLNALIASAAKWYGGNGTPRSGALAYYAMNMRERTVVERLHAKAIFVTFNGSDLSPLFPETMPIFYMYSIRKGCAVKPWFMASPEDAITTDDNMFSNRASATPPFHGTQ
jgi:L-tyrosine isonitrile synthase